MIKSGLLVCGKTEVKSKKEKQITKPNLENFMIFSAP
jgi:hypothetical protein